MTCYYNAVVQWKKDYEMAAEPERLKEAFVQALYRAKAYLLTMEDAVSNRGSEGTIVNYYKTIFQYIYVLQEWKLGIPISEAYEKREMDTPLSPMI